MFGVHWSGARGDMTYLICNVTLQEHIIECMILQSHGLVRSRYK